MEELARSVERKSTSGDENYLVPNNYSGKSSVRQQCEAQAQQQFNATRASLNQGFWSQMESSTLEGDAGGAIASSTQMHLQRARSRNRLAVWRLAPFLLLISLLALQIAAQNSGNPSPAGNAVVLVSKAVPRQNAIRR